MTDAPDMEPAALAKWLEGEADHQERTAARYKAASTSRHTYARRAEIFRASAAYLAARSAPEAGKAVDAPQFTLRQVGEISFEDPEDEGPITGIVLEGSVGAVRAAAKFFGEKVCVIPATALASSPAPTGAEPAELAKFTIKLFGDGSQVHTEASGGNPHDLLTRAITALQCELGELSACPFHKAAPQPVAPTGEIAGLVRKLTNIADASRREDGSDIPLGEQVREAAAAVTASEAEAADLRRKLEEVELERNRLRENVKDLGDRKRVTGHFRDEYKARAEAAERKLEEARKALEPFGRNADASSLAKVYAHLTRENAQTARTISGASE